MKSRALYFFFIAITVVGCARTISEYQEQTNDLIKGCDSTEFRLSEIDTADLIGLMQDAHMNMIDFKANLKDDTLDLETARELDAFVRSYALCKNFKVAYHRAKYANDSLRIRLTVLLNDIKTGAGDRSDYAIALKKERKEMKAIRSHASYLDSINGAFNEAYLQFKPIFERYLRQDNP